MQVELQQWKEIPYRNELGKVTAIVCNHPLIPGLEASGCKICKVWWVDEQQRSRQIEQKSSKQQRRKAA